MSGTAAIGGAEFFEREGGFPQQALDLSGRAALIEEIRPFPDLKNIGFFEEVVDVPVEALFFPEVPVDPPHEAVAGFAYVKIEALFKSF